MKRTITKFLMILGLSTGLVSQAQTTIETFESYTVTPKGYYKDTLSTGWESSQAVFRYRWTYMTTPFTASYWSDGYAYANLADSIHGSYDTLYTVKSKTGYNGSAFYVVGQPGGFIKMKNPNTRVDGFYVTNTTYAHRSIKNGDAFARKFGDTTGTGSGTSIPQGSYPDWFKLIVRSYKNGSLTNDSVQFYLADYRFSNNTQDYVVKNWQWVDCSSLGAVDSITCVLKSSDNNMYGMNTPAFFAFDNFTTTQLVNGIEEKSLVSGMRLFPNPVAADLHVQYHSLVSAPVGIKVFNVIGTAVVSAEVLSQAGLNDQLLDVSSLAPGIYVAEIGTGASTQKIKFIKQ